MRIEFPKMRGCHEISEDSAIASAGARICGRMCLGL